MNILRVIFRQRATDNIININSYQDAGINEDSPEGITGHGSPAESFW